MFKRRQPERRDYGRAHDLHRAAKVGRQLEKEVEDDLDMQPAGAGYFLPVTEREGMARARLEELRQKGQEGLDVLSFIVEAVPRYEAKLLAAEVLGEFAETEENLDFRPAVHALRAALAEDNPHLRDREIKKLHLAISDAYKKITGNYPSQCNGIWDKATD